MRPADLTADQELEAISRQLDRWKVKSGSKFDGRYSVLSRIRLLRNESLKVVIELQAENVRLRRLLEELGRPAS